MLGTDDDDPEEGSGPDDGMDDLAAAAEGDSVTADRLRGDVKYFPDCRPALLEAQQPHHLILLTNGPVTFQTTGGGPGVGAKFDAGTGGVALVTEESLLVIVDASVCEVAYANVQGCLREYGEIEIHGTGSLDYVLHLASSADDAEIAAGLDFLRRKIREHS